MITCVKTDSPTTAAAASIDLEACRDRFSEFTAAIAGRFPRVEPRRHATAFLRALMSGIPRANCWTLSEHAGYRSPDAFQYLLSQSAWDHDGVRDDLRAFVVGLGRERAVLVLDETGDVKKGVHTVGVQRQYTGTAGRIENAQVAVYAVWAGRRGAAFVDRELYVPRSWTSDPARCSAAGLPQDLVFATKPALALRIVQRTVAAEAVPGFVAGDEVYGNDPRLRAGLEQLSIGYVLAVASGATAGLVTGPLSAGALAAGLPAQSWQLRSAGQGSKGQRWYQWAYVSLAETSSAGGERYLLVRRNRSTGELAFYRCWTPAAVALAELVRVAGTRWSIEEAFQTGKGLTALDEHQVRRYTSWCRWTVLVMLAHAFLTVLAAEQPDPQQDTAMIALTRNETAHLLALLLFTPDHPEQHRWRWSTWRRRHQWRARHCHYRRQQTLPRQPLTRHSTGALPVTPRERDDNPVHDELRQSWDFQLQAARDFDADCDNDHTWPPPILTALLSAVQATTLRRLHPFISHARLCLSTHPCCWEPTARNAPAFISLAPEGHYNVWSANPYTSSPTLVLETEDPDHAAAQLEQLLTAWA